MGTTCQREEQEWEPKGRKLSKVEYRQYVREGNRVRLHSRGKKIGGN
jgi:hypothetical protein